MFTSLRRATALATLLAAAVGAGARAEEESAIRFEAAYTADLLSNLHGGVETGTRYLDNLELGLELEGERAFGWKGATFFISGLYNNGKGFAEDLVGAGLEVSNIEADVRAARLFEAWAEQRFLDDRASILVGLYELSSEFDAVETAELFLNGAFEMSTTFLESGLNGPSVFPYTALTLRAAARLTDSVTLRAAVLDGVPGDPDHPKRTAVKLRDGDGALLVSEAEYAGDGFRAAVGYWRYTARFEEIGAGIDSRGNDGLYALAEAEVYADPDDPRRGLALFARAGWASARFNEFRHSFALGGVYTGALPARPEDKLGLAVGMAEASGPLRRLEALKRREIAIELTYRAEITEYLAIQPDLQYVINPGLVPGRDDAFVAGLRLELSWGAGL